MRVIRVSSVRKKVENPNFSVQNWATTMGITTRRARNIIKIAIAPSVKADDLITIDSVAYDKYLKEY